MQNCYSRAHRQTGRRRARAPPKKDRENEWERRRFPECRTAEPHETWEVVYLQEFALYWYYEVVFGARGGLPDAVGGSPITTYIFELRTHTYVYMCYCAMSMDGRWPLLRTQADITDRIVSGKHVRGRIWMKRKLVEKIDCGLVRVRRDLTEIAFCKQWKEDTLHKRWWHKNYLN